jgi:hypothetical protein
VNFIGPETKKRSLEDVAANEETVSTRSFVPLASVAIGEQSRPRKDE